MPFTGETKGSMRLLWVGPSTRESRELVENTAREFKLTVRFGTYAELFELLRAEPSDLIGIEFGDTGAEGLALLRELHKRIPGVTTLAVSSDSSVAAIRGALQAGASDFLSLPLHAQELHKALIKFTQVDVRPGVHRGSIGQVITIWGARGGLGVTTIAVNLAVRLAALTGAEVALVDLDVQRGDVAAFLNLTPLQSIASIAAAHGEIDDVLLRATLTRHSSGVFVLPAPVQVEEAEAVGHDEVSRTLAALRTQFRYTVIDTPRMMSGATLAGFEQSDRILVLSDLSVPGVRAAQRAVELLARLRVPNERIELLVTQAIPGPVKLQEAARAIGKQPFLIIPRDAATASEAMNAGVPFNGSKPSGLVQAINELATKLGGTHVASRPKRAPLLQRIFAKGAQT